MGHDISAYLKTKSNPDPVSNWNDSNEIAYFRIGAFSTIRQRLFYGIIPNSNQANGGVSGNGKVLDFTREDIATAINACKYFMEDDIVLYDNVLSQKQDAEESIKAFGDVFAQVLGKHVNMPSDDVENYSMTEARENIADIWKFCEDILSEYDDAKKTDESAQIQIYFG